MVEEFDLANAVHDMSVCVYIGEGNMRQGSSTSKTPKRRACFKTPPPYP